MITESNLHDNHHISLFLIQSNLSFSSIFYFASVFKKLLFLTSSLSVYFKVTIFSKDCENRFPTNDIIEAGYWLMLISF